jgi:hypothetical protein
MAGDARVGEAVGAPLSAGPAAVGAAVRLAVVASASRQWLAINLLWWLAVAAAGAAVAARAGAAVGATVPQVGAAVMVGQQAMAAAILQVTARRTRIGVPGPAQLEQATASVPASGSRGLLGSASVLARASSGLGSGASPSSSRGLTRALVTFV